MAFSGSALAHNPIIGISPSSIEFRVDQGRDPAPQYLFVRNETHKTMAFSVTCAASWMQQFGPKSAFLPGLTEGESVELAFNPSTRTFEAGIHSTTCTIVAPGGADYPAADNSPFTFPVTVIVTGSTTPPKVRATPETVSFSDVAGTAKTLTSTIAISNAGTGTLNWTATVDPPTATWLRVTPVTGTNAATITAQATTTGLPAGTHRATVRLNSPESTATVAVSLELRAARPAVLQAGASSIAFIATEGGAPPEADIIPITNGGESALNWRAAATTFNGGNWLRVSPASGTNQGAVQAVADSSSLSAGVYSGRVTLTADGAQNSPVNVPVTLTVRVPAAVVNAASFLGGPLAPCSLATLFGVKVGPETGVAATGDSNGLLPRELGGVSVTMGGIRAPMVYASSTQTTFQIPCELQGDEAALRLDITGGSPTELRLRLQAAAPGIFTVDGTRAAALNPDYSTNSPSNPLPAGGVIQLFVTGQGAVEPKVATGMPATGELRLITLPVAAVVGGRTATVQFKGLAPGLIGLAQVNVEIPIETEPSDAVAVDLLIGDVPAKRVVIAISAAAPPQ